MDEKERIELIRLGNQFYNEKKYKEALEIFLKTNYVDGIIRIADYFYFDKNDKISGIKLYKRAGYTKMIEDFASKAATIIKLLLTEDKQNIENKNLIKNENNNQTIKSWNPITLKAEDLIIKKGKDEQK